MKNERMDGRITDGRTDVQRETIIPRHYRVEGYKKKECCLLLLQF